MVHALGTGAWRKASYTEWGAVIPLLRIKRLIVHETTANSAALQNKNAVCEFIKHSRYIYLTNNFTSIHSHAERLYLHMFDLVDTAFSYEKRN